MISNGVERAPFRGRQQYPQIDLAISFNDERGHLADHRSLDGPRQVIHREANGGEFLPVGRESNRGASHNHAVEDIDHPWNVFDNLSDLSGLSAQQCWIAGVQPDLDRCR